MSLAICAGLVLPAAPAEATFPGRNGVLVAELLDGGRYYSRTARRLDVINPRTRRRRVLQQCIDATAPRQGTCLWAPRFSPSGRLLAVISDESDGRSLLGLMSSDGSDLRTADPNAVLSALSWSPRGNRIAFVRRSADGTSRTLAVGFLDGREHRELVTPASDPDWGVRGILTFESQESSSQRAVISVLRPGGRPRRVTRPGASPFAGDDDPSWSPDGRWIAFARRGSHIYVVRPSGRGLRRLGPRHPVGADPYVRSPVWSPDGRQIAFIWDGDIYVMRRDGRRLRRVAKGDASTITGSGDYLDLDWQPLPRR
jgi:Tol biopolymer transport system component